MSRASDDVSDYDSDSNSNEPNVNSDDETNIEEVTVSKEFQEHVIKYVKLDNSMKRKKEEVAELNNQRKPHEEYILDALSKMEGDCINLADGKLKRVKKETIAAIKDDNIKSCLSKKIEDPAIIQQILDDIQASRTKTEKYNLTRAANRKSKGKSKPKSRGKRA